MLKFQFCRTRLLQALLSSKSCFFIKPPVICEILSALEPGKWGGFRTEKVRMTYASSALSLSATNGNLATALDLLQQEVIDLLLQPLDLVVQISNVGID